MPQCPISDAYVRFPPIADISWPMHRRDMAMGYEPERNCGCIAAMLVATPVALLWLVGNALGGFGCEGAEQPCTSGGSRFWLGVIVIIGGSLALAWLINAVRRRLRDKRK